MNKANIYDLTIVSDALIGDYVMWHDTIAAYKESYSDKRILLVCDERLIDIAKSDNFYNEIIGFNRKMMRNPSYLLSISRKLHCIRTGCLIYPSTTRHLDGEILTCSLRAKERIGFRGYAADDVFWKSLMRKIFSIRYSKLVEVPSKNEIRALEYFTREIVSANYNYGRHPLKVKRVDFSINGKYVVIALSSSIDAKIWRAENFAKVIDEIPSQYRIILSGVGKSDMKRASIIKTLVADKQRITDMIDKTSIFELLSLIAQASFVIGNDSSAVHIAAATHVPSICVFHGAHFDRFLPYPNDLENAFYNPRAVYFKMDCFGCGYRCNKPRLNGSLWCLDKVSVEMVTVELNKLLKEIEYRNELSKSN